MGAAAGHLVANEAGFRIATVAVLEAWVLATTYGFTSGDDARRLVATLDRCMAASAKGHLIVDSREHGVTCRAANEAMWNWVEESSHLESMSIINKSQNIALAIRMKNLSSKARKVRPFSSLSGAETWVRKAQRSPPSRTGR